MGEKAAEAIVNERKEHGPYKSFMDFLERLDLHTVNKRAIEVMIKTGTFDKLGINRPTLIRNMEKAIDYAEAKKNGTENGQASLFDGTDEKEFPDFKYEEVEDSPKQEKLNQEKECIGCYVSGHPLDDYKKVIQLYSTVTSSTIEREAETEKIENAKTATNEEPNQSWQQKNNGKTHTAIGMLSELRAIRTKKGADMAFASLQDFTGAIALTFFPKTWEKLKGQLEEGKVYAFKGKIDSSRDEPSFLVNEIANLDSLKERSIHELHIKINNNFNNEAQIDTLKNILFGSQGNCSVYFHIETEKGPFIVKANSQISAPSSSDFLEKLELQPYVKEVWTS